MTLPRVLVVDDSAFARTVLSKLLRASGQVEVVGTAYDGTEALAQIDALDPDAITLDLTMPGLDGLGVLRALAGRDRPRAIVVSISGIDTELGAEALALGAIDLVEKPTALATDRLREIGDALIARVVAACGPRPVPASIPVAATVAPSAIELVMIGASTGGPQALTRIVSQLPANLGAALAMVLHIPVGYTEALAKRLDALSPLRVVEAQPDVALEPGTVVLARAGKHLRVRRDPAGVLRCELTAVPVGLFVPSVDELFASGADVVGARGLGVVLTGMGDDGLAGSRRLAAAGAGLITESAETCVVYGMPRCVDEAGLGATSLPLPDITAEIVRRVRPR